MRDLTPSNLFFVATNLIGFYLFLSYVKIKVSLSRAYLMKLRRCLNIKSGLFLSSYYWFKEEDFL
jgi:hypothetical protein